MMLEWADDPGARYTVNVRCVEPTPSCDLCGEWEPEQHSHTAMGLEVGCGWSGTVRAVRQYGAVTLETEQCLECGGAVETET